jgi:hypothetical protein
MASDDDIHNALLAIHSRLDVVEGKVTVIARADRSKLLDELKKAVTANPIIGRIFLAIDGKKNQEQLRAELDIGAATMSRWIQKLAREHGMIELVPGREAGKIYRHERQMEDVLALSSNVAKWLAEAEKSKPQPKRKDSGK